MPRTLSLPGYSLYPLAGRYLIFSEDTACLFVNEHMSLAIPLFNGDAGRFTIEAKGFIAFPESVEPLIYDTGAPYERFHVSDQLTEADLIF